MEDGTIVAAYHEYSDDEQPIHYLMCTRFKLCMELKKIQFFKQEMFIRK
ncbi:MAG: hypothetical protein HWN79_00540 [Candidatus Lokiarchaeota archaeon]|nr:hypothetical protein [Candidatus Lokiarchaeota archaeon]